MGGDEVGVDWPSFRWQLAPPGSTLAASCPPGLLPKDPVRASWPAVTDFAAEKALAEHLREGGGGASTMGRAALRARWRGCPPPWRWWDPVAGS